MDTVPALPVKTVWDSPTPPIEQWLSKGWKPLPVSKEEQSALQLVLRPHVLYGPMAASLVLGKWVVAGGNMWFPEDAFEPYWTQVPAMPWRHQNGR